MKLLDEIIRECVIERLRHFKGNVRRTTVSLGVSPTFIYPNLARWGVDVNEIRFEERKIQSVKPSHPALTVLPTPQQLDHPCRQTCSGWSQGFERGREISKRRISELLARVQEIAETLAMEKERK